MDLSGLDSNLPPGLADAERIMGDKFRAAALSITNLYKSSLSYTKQSYHAGYSSCIADMLLIVQSAIANGQDPSQTLSRLMDWAEARENAMAAFAEDEMEEPASASHGPSPSQQVKRATLAKQALANINPPNRPSSAPIPIHGVKDTPSEQHIRTFPTNTPNSEPSSISSSTAYLAPLMSSSPSAPSSSSLPRQVVNLPVQSRRRTHSPSRSNQRTEVTSNGGIPTANFNPALPNLPTMNSTTTPTPAPQLGSKRPLTHVDFEMGEGETAAAPPSTPSAKSGRASKRRSMGNNLTKSDDDKEEKERDKRKGGRRGHGGGPNGPGGQSVL